LTNKFGMNVAGQGVAGQGVGHVTGQGAVVSGPSAGARVVRELTVAPVSLNDPFPKKFKVYTPTSAPTSANAFAVPLHWARAAGFALRDVRPEPEAAPALVYTGSLREDLRQPEAAEAVRRAWDATGGATLCLPVGFGKTQVALYLAAQLRTKTLVVVHKSFLADQWAERVAQVLPGARVSRVQGDECDLGGDVVIAMIQTLVSRQYPASTFARCGLLIVDEAHHIGAAVFSQAMLRLCLRRTLGLTATPVRKDGLMRVMTWFLGDIAFRLQRERQASTEVRIARYSCDAFREPPPVNRRGDVCFVSVVTRLCADERRTAFVCRHVLALAAREGRDVLVLSHRREHCRAIADRVNVLAGGQAAGKPLAATYLGGDKQAPDTRVVVATYSLTSEGFDMPRLNALVLATPASDVEQSCGRVMRGSSAAGAVIVDVADEWGVCFAQLAKRRGLYRRSGFTVSSDAADGTTSHVPDDDPQVYGFLE
jgi:superfamily II DNA or RNA helicase